MQGQIRSLSLSFAPTYENSLKKKPKTIYCRQNTTFWDWWKRLPQTKELQINFLLRVWVEKISELTNEAIGVIRDKYLVGIDHEGGLNAEEMNDKNIEILCTKIEGATKDNVFQYLDNLLFDEIELQLDRYMVKNFDNPFNYLFEAEKIAKKYKMTSAYLRKYERKADAVLREKYEKKGLSMKGLSFDNYGYVRFDATDKTAVFSHEQVKQLGKLLGVNWTFALSLLGKELLAEV
ncbi:MAG: hypothetical protein EZS28_050141, partial [Streblomastix strix]